MLKKLGVIALLFLGSLILAVGLISPIFDMVIGIASNSQVIADVIIIVGIIIIVGGVILYKKYL
jgi:hypothetical protein